MQDPLDPLGVGGLAVSIVGLLVSVAGLIPVFCAGGDRLARRYKFRWVIDRKRQKKLKKMVKELKIEFGHLDERNAPIPGYTEEQLKQLRDHLKEIDSQIKAADEIFKNLEAKEEFLEFGGVEAVQKLSEDLLKNVNAEWGYMKVIAGSCNGDDIYDVMASRLRQDSEMRGQISCFCCTDRSSGTHANIPADWITRRGIVSDGRFYKVYEAKHVHHDAVVALKQVKEENDENLKQLNKEMKIFSHLTSKRCHRIVPTFGTFCPKKARTDLQKHFMIQKYVCGGSLESRLLEVPFEEPPAPEFVSLVVRVLIDVGEGLQELHKENVCHRNIKPRHILLGVDERASFSDLRQSCFSIEGANSHEALQRPQKDFLAPELIRDNQRGHEESYRSGKFNVWSIGALLFRIMCQDTLYADDTDTQIHDRLGNEDLYRENLNKLDDEPANEWSIELRDLARKCLAFNPSDRPEDMRDVVSVLSEFRKSGGTRTDLTEVPGPRDDLMEVPGPCDDLTEVPGPHDDLMEVSIARVDLMDVSGPRDDSTEVSRARDLMEVSGPRDDLKQVSRGGDERMHRSPRRNPTENAGVTCGRMESERAES